MTAGCRQAVAERETSHQRLLAWITAVLSHQEKAQ